MNTPHPIDELKKVALVGIATTYKCPHCVVDNRMNYDGQTGWFVEHHHQDGCPEHEDFGPAAECGG